MQDAAIERYVYDDIHNGMASLDGGNVVLDFVDSDGPGGSGAMTLSKRYLWGERVDELLAQEDVTKSLTATDRVLWPIVDHLGTVRDLVKQDGTVATHFVYTAFGGIVSGDTSLTRYLFTSHEFDADTGLQYNRFRWYDASVGRWISEDPLGFAAGDVNTARYVGNDPKAIVDPSGLIVEGSGGERSWGGFFYDWTVGWVIPRSFWSYREIGRKQRDVSRAGQRAVFEAIEKGKDFPVAPGREMFDPQPETTRLLTDMAEFGVDRMASGPIFTARMLSKSVVIAKGKKIDKIDDLVKEFGGTRKGWVKKKGRDELGREWHWYEHHRIGRKLVKRVGEADPKRLSQNPLPQATHPRPENGAAGFVTGSK